MGIALNRLMKWGMVLVMGLMGSVACGDTLTVPIRTFTGFIGPIYSVAVTATTGIVPGKSVGKVVLGMSREEVQSLLGEPTGVEDDVMVYRSEKTGNVLLLGCSDVVELILFSSPDFTAADGLSTRNAMTEAGKAGYRRWTKKGAEYTGWSHPQGGLAFFLDGPSVDNPVLGVVYKKELSLSQALSDDELHEVNSATSDTPISTDSDWDGERAIPKMRPADGMLVVKELFLGMHIAEALRILDNAINFSFAKEIDPRSDGGYDVYFNVYFEIGEGALTTTIVEVNKYGTFEVSDVAMALVGDKIEQLVEASNTAKNQAPMLLSVEKAIEQVVKELNSGLGRCTWLIQSGDKGHSGVTLDLGTRLVADANQNVVSIGFGSSLVDHWFNVSDMTGQAFAQQFLDSYNVPELQVSIEQNALFGTSSMYWHHTSPAGYQLTIGENKQLAIEAVATASERRFD